MLGGASNARVIYRSDIVHPRHQANFRSAELATKPRSPGPPQRRAPVPRASGFARSLGRSAAARVVLRTALWPACASHLSAVAWRQAGADRRPHIPHPLLLSPGPRGWFALFGASLPQDPEQTTPTISLDPPARPVVACPSTSACGEVPSPAGPFLRWPVPGVLTLPGMASFQLPVRRQNANGV